ncbi:MAG: hypothetical protein HY056_01430 [Proteobacteria bacterium]|nr:hypothetical protein [Pseudomonadota bacterium]
MRRSGLIASAGALAFVAATSVALAQSNMDKARNRIQSTLPADGAVKADPKPKPSPVGQPVSDYKPKVRVKPSAPPPSPTVTPDKTKKK